MAYRKYNPNPKGIDTGSHEDLMRHLEAAMDTAQNDRERTAINELMDKMKMM